MRKLIPGAIFLLVGVVIAIAGAAYNDETKFVGVLIGESRCHFVYKTPIGRDVHLSAAKFCEMNTDVVNSVNDRARVWLRENPIDHPEDVARKERLIRELRQYEDQEKK